MPIDYSFQAQVYIFILGFIILLTVLWFYFLQRYFSLLKGADDVAYKALGSPDFKRARFPNEYSLLKHLFLDLKTEHVLVKKWHDRLRFAFFVYIFLFMALCIDFVFPTFF